MRFGQEDVLIQVYVRELLKLVLQNTEVNKVNLSSLYDKIEAQLRALESLGVTKEKYAAMLFPLVDSCLHAEILHAWERCVGYIHQMNQVLDNKLLSSNRKLAENRLESTKRKLIATGKFEEYQDVLDLWLSGKIIEEVNDDKENFVHYLPHKPVIKENSTKLESQPDNFETMVLGLIWNLKHDCLSCNINCQKSEGKAITKRSLLSIANHIFDPIGFTAPVTLKPKLILQEIWKLKLKWDENLPKDILNQVKKWVKEIRNLSDVSSWEQVPSEENFADILSRGCSAQQLVYLRWWEGPSWLSESPVQCPKSKQVPDEEAVNLELRKSVLVNTAKKIEEFNWCSDLTAQQNNSKTELN
ncbi:integrase catalytic domain-containing protein [Trichonephila clavipes]|nr:integrase catalytic domain-containing protein [Trichonephila clavipes]